MRALGYHFASAASRRQDARSTAIDCGIAMGGVAIAIIVRQLLDRYLGAHQAFSTFYIAVFFAAWFGGWVPGLVTLGLSALAADYCFMEPRRSLMLSTSEEMIGMLTFFIVGTAAILFSEANRAARERAEEIAEQLRLHESELQNEVTERRAAENSLRASEEKARRLIDSNVIGVIVFDTEGRIEQANEAFVRMLGYTKSEFEHLSPKPTWRELTPPEFTDRDENAMREMASRGRCDAYEKTFIKKDGMRVPVLFGGATFDAPLAGGTAFILDLSEIQRARQTLQLQSRVLESMTEGVVVVDMSHAKDDPPHAHVVFTNPAADAMYGYERNELIGRPLAEISDLTLDERRDVIEEIELALRVRGNWSGELHGRKRRDGSTFVAEATVVRLRESPDVTGRPTETAPEFWICVQQDVTARRQVEHAARASEQRLELAMAAAEMGTWEINLATGMLKASQQVRSLIDESTATARATREEDDDDPEVTETSSDPIPMETFYQRIHPDDRERVRQSVLDAIAGKLDYDVEFRGMRENGKTRWLHARAAVFHDDAGRPVRLTGFTLDVTASRAAAEAQRISEERFRLAADAVQSVIYDQDIKTNRTHRSSGLQRVLGFGAKPPGSELAHDDAIPTGDWWRSRIHRDDIARYEADRTHAITSGESTFSCEYRMQHRDGHYVNVWDRAILVRDPENGEVVRVVGSTMDISDRAYAEARLRRLVDSNIIGVNFATPERVMQANDAYLQMVGYTREDLEAGKVVWRDMTPPEHAHLDERATAELRERGACTPYEKEYIRKDGTRVPVLLGAAALDPQVSEWVCFAADLSERKRAAEALKQSEHRYRTFIAQSGEGVWRFEASEPIPLDLPVDEQIQRYVANHLAECNDAMARMYGFTSADQLLDRRCDEMLIADDPRNIEYLRALVSNGYRISDAESVERDVNGRVRYFVNNVVGTIEGGKLVRAWGTQRDVTDRKLAEELLRHSEERFRQFAEASRDVLWIHDAKENRLEYVSPAFEQIWGRTCDEILSEQGKWYQWLHEDDRERASRAMADVLNAGIVEIDYRIVRPDGSVRWIHDSGFVIKDDGGSQTRVGGIATDITDRRAAEDELLQAKEAAENADRAKDQFLAVLSHELRTPLTPVLGVVQILGRDPTVPQHVRDELEMIHRNIDLEARLIDDLLDLTRVARGKIELHVQPCDVHDSMRRAAEICKPALDEKQLSVKLELAAERPIVSGDPARLQQVLWNLVKNAVKFTPSHGGEIVIQTCNEAIDRDGASRDMLVLKVIDRGIGIEPEAMQRIFNAFEQGTRAIDGRYGGLGLGLSISKTLADLHGGELHAESEGPGKGATFILRLPTTTQEMPRAPREVPSTRVIEDTSPGSELRILLVEDHEDTARVMSRVLRQMKYHVTTAGDVASALRLASSDVFDLVISDLGLPDGSGLDLMRQLLEEKREGAADVKAIALSGYGMEADRERCREAGFLEHLTKPVDLQRLSETIQRVTLSDRA